VKSKFVEAIQNYQQVEQQYRTKYKQRMERQYKIVKPDATPEEVKAVVNDEQGGQIFSQAVSQGQSASHFTRSSFLNSFLIPTVMVNPERRTMRSRHDTRTSRRLRGLWRSWPSCSMMCAFVCVFRIFTNIIFRR
jgi:hypothetical protein